MARLTVIGHIAPDTDTVSSAICYAWLLRKLGKDAEGFVAGDLNRETKFVLNKFSVETPKIKASLSENEKVILVDTNNPEEVVEGLANAELVEIIDHHKLAGLKTDSPVKVKISTVGSTATLIYRRANFEKVDLSEDMAGLLLAAIISDTLKFTSPTTTEEDEKAANILAGIAKIDIEELAQEMFSEKSDLEGMSARDILMTDSKVFEMAGKKVRVSVLETTNPDNAKKQIENLKAEMQKIKSEEKLDGAYFFIVDILNSNSELAVTSDDERAIAERAFDAVFDDGFLFLKGVVSRKKQIVPNLEKAYGEA